MKENKQKSVLELAERLLNEVRESGVSLEEPMAIIGVVREMLPISGVRPSGITVQT